MKKKRAKRVSKAIREVWESLDSHLDFTYSKHPDGNKFHKKAVRDYAKLLVLLSKLY